MTEDVIALTRELLRIPSENPPGEEGACARYIYEWFDERGIDATLISQPDPDRPSVAARIGSGYPTVVLNGHTDVVPAGDLDTWRYPPYEAVIDDGRIYGRGATDMKAGLAVAMTVAMRLRKAIEADELAGSIIVHAAAGEETGYPGTASLIDAGFGGDLAIVLEPTELRVATSAKGVATFRFGVEGIASHASRPDDGENAIDGLRRLLDLLAEYDDDIRAFRDPLVGHAYATVTEVQSGIDSNMAVVPDRAELLLDRRLLPGETIDSVQGELDELQARHRSNTIDRSLVQFYEPAAIDPGHFLAEVLRKHTGNRTGVSSEPYGLEAATDARSFIAEGIDAVIWGPGHLAQAHTVDEWVSTDEMRLAEEILVDALRELLTDSRL